MVLPDKGLQEDPMIVLWNDAYDIRFSFINLRFKIEKEKSQLVKLSFFYFNEDVTPYRTKNGALIHRPSTCFGSPYQKLEVEQSERDCDQWLWWANYLHQVHDLGLQK